MSYTPYGEKVKSASTGPDIFHQKYTGQVDDTSASLSASGEDEGLMYYNARYYDPMIGRVISADSIIPDAGFSQSFNRYMYVAGNSVNRNDPRAIVGAGIGYAVGGGLNYIFEQLDPDYKDSKYHLSSKQYALIGAMSGAVGGGTGATVADFARGYQFAIKKANEAWIKHVIPILFSSW